MADKRPPKQHGVELDHEQFCCSVCLDLLDEPVTINCGHSYCRGCIEGFWDRVEEKGWYSCPQCREAFNPRPALKRNNMLAEVVEKLKTNPQQPARSAAPACAGPADCDFCPGAEPNKATMSCLTCLASFCPGHLQPHYSVAVLKTHQLVSATVPLQEKMCTQHNKLMEIYCQTDEQLVCSLCTLDEHKGHTLVSVSAQKAEAQSLLALSQKEVQQRFQQREKELRELNQAEEHLKGCAETAMIACDRIFARLISTLQRSRGEVERLIKAQEETAVVQAGGLRLQLEEEITKLRRRDAELEQLLRADDHIHLIKIFQSISTTCGSPDFSPGAGPLRSFTEVTDCVSELRKKLKKVLRETWPRITATVCYVNFSLPPVPKTREEFLRYCCPLTLDDTTNNPYLHLTNGNLRVRPTASPYSTHPDRFAQFSQVLCREGLSERCYWEVEGYARTVSAAVAYRDVSRAADDSGFGNSDKSWSLERRADGYSFRHNNVETEVAGPQSDSIGVYLDYRAGTLCFYQACDQMVLLHKVQTTFTQPLYPGLGLKYEWYDVGVFAQIVKLW